MKLIEKLILWVARKQLKEQDWISYQKGWEAGVDQQRTEPKSTEHYSTIDEDGIPWDESGQVE